VIPTLPLALRNRLAATILKALDDRDARIELAALGTGAGTERWLAGEEPRWTGPLTTRAQAAATALDQQPLLAARADLAQALQAAATLFDAGLYFEVHEVLEPHWTEASGPTRQALQGLIQIAVGWQHLANGNLMGARSLLIEGSERLHGAGLLDLDLEPLARAAVEAAARLGLRGTIPAPRFPRA
jgi:predicted metal-dependent hydrolase